MKLAMAFCLCGLIAVSACADSSATRAWETVPRNGDAARAEFLTDLALTTGQAAFSRKDYDTALGLWMPLAEQGNAGAEDNIGWMYETGEGERRDYAEAFFWHLLAARTAHGNRLSFEAYTAAREDSGHLRKEQQQDIRQRVREWKPKYYPALAANYP